MSFPNFQTLISILQLFSSALLVRLCPSSFAFASHRRCFSSASLPPIRQQHLHSSSHQGDNNDDNNNIILWICCFSSSNSNTNKSTRHTDTSLCCCCCTSPRSNRKATTTTSTTSSAKRKRKGFCWGLFSCFRSRNEPSPPSSLPRIPPNVHSKQDGRHPLDESYMDYPPPEYSGRNPRRASFEELNYPRRDHKMDERCSRAMHYDDFDKPTLNKKSDPVV